MTLVLLHGASGNAASWAPIRPAFAGLDVVAVDMPGRGASTSAAVSTVAAAATWLANWLGQAGASPVVLLGHSYGGAIALQLALDHPALVSGLVMVSSASRLGVHPAILKAVASSTPDMPYRLDAAFGTDTDTDVVQAYSRTTASVPPVSALADWTACDGFDVRHRLHEASIPVLIVHGDADALTVPKHQARLQDALPNARRVTLPGIGHMLPWEAPDALARAVRQWLDTVPHASQ